jgi:glutaconate CoA-transferase, subunit B
MLSKKITRQELLVVAAARQIQNGDVTILGIGLPIIAGAVAKKTHAPEAVLLMESGICDFEPRVLPMHVADASCTRGYGYATDLFSVFTTITHAGYLDKAFLGVGQIDRYGNINTSYLGTPPDAQRISAAGGAPEFYAYAKKSILTMKGGQFVEKLPYLTSPGYLGGGNEREASGRYTPGSGPSVLLTPKGMFKFDDETKEMYLAAPFPGVTVERIKADIPWDLKVADELGSFPIPTDDEIIALREFSPRASFSSPVAVQLVYENFQRKIAAARKN